jgi:hypothetical protein
MRSFINILRNLGITTDELSTLSNPRPKIYRALLTQSDENPPQATILENTIGDINWTRISPGRFKGFNNNLRGNKIFPSQGAFSDPINGVMVGWFILDGFIELYTYDVSEGAAADGYMPNQFPLEIYLYP